MKIAITGGSGQLGTLLLRRLINDRTVRQIVTIDRLPPLWLSGKLQVLQEDVRAPDLGRHFHGCDAVIHLAFVVTDYPVSYTHLRAHETRHDLVCRLLLEKKK